MKIGRIASTAVLAATAPLLGASLDRETHVDARLLAAHNRERAAMGVPALEWDAGLAADAGDWARALAETNSFAHSRANPTDPDVQGENLWAGTRGAWAPEEMVGLWISEKRDYRAGVFPAVSRSGKLERVGHYTQVIWRDTRRVGCAIASTDSEDILVCRYSTGGNVIGQRVT